MTRIRATHAIAAIVGVILLTTPAGAQVMPDVMGTKKSAKKWMTKARSYAKQNGIDALITAIGEDGNKFHESIHHIAVHRINDSGRIFVARHNHYDSLKNIDMTNQQDLDGKYFIKSFADDVRGGGGTTSLKLQIGETQKVKKSWCMNRWAPGEKGDYFITVCY